MAVTASSIEHGGRVSVQQAVDGLSERRMVKPGCVGVKRSSGVVNHTVEIGSRLMRDKLSSTGADTARRERQALGRADAMGDGVSERDDSIG